MREQPQPVLLLDIGGHAPIKVQRYRKKLVEGHVIISVTLFVPTKNSTDLERVLCTELKSAEFFVGTKRVTEIFDIHTDFTAGQMLHLFRSMTQVGGVGGGATRPVPMLCVRVWRVLRVWYRGVMPLTP